MNSLEDEAGRPAFPVAYEESDRGDKYTVTHHGMTLRDYFAGQAIVGLLASPRGANGSMWDAYAKAAYAMADAMLAQKKQSQ